MDNIISKYYDGYEGEPEIQFIKVSNSGSKTILSIWDGYFDDIMRHFLPTGSGWTGLAYYYHICIGWEEESPWKIPDLNEALAEFQSLNPQKLEFNTSPEVLYAICELIATAIKKNEQVWIAKD